MEKIWKAAFLAWWLCVLALCCVKAQAQESSLDGPPDFPKDKLLYTVTVKAYLVYDDSTESHIRMESDWEPAEPQSIEALSHDLFKAIGKYISSQHGRDAAEERATKHLELITYRWWTARNTPLAPIHCPGRRLKVSPPKPVEPEPTPASPAELQQPN